MCPFHTQKKVYLLKELSDSSEILTHSHCSSIRIFFGFPGMKEKEKELNQVIKNIWKYIGRNISTITIIRISLEYDLAILDILKSN